MEFIARRYESRLNFVNVEGDIGLVTLWTPVRQVLRRLSEETPAMLNPKASRICVVTNLYGDGLFAMFSNLLYNPQVRHIVAIGVDLGQDTTHELRSFLDRGLEAIDSPGGYQRISGGRRIFPDVPQFDVARLRRQFSFAYLGGFGRDSCRRIERFVASLPRRSPVDGGTRIEVPDDLERRVASWHRPEPEGHVVEAGMPADCWEELVVRGLRFGETMELPDGPRVELRNIRTVVREPMEDDVERLRSFGFDLTELRAYRRSMNFAELYDESSYTYGNRLFGYFSQVSDCDTLATVVRLLRRSPTSRAAYISLWDSSVDLPREKSGRTGIPCLTALSFRRLGRHLSLLAIFRSQNLLSAWMPNCYGLSGLQERVAKELSLDVGALTMYCNSLAIDPQSDKMAAAKAIEKRWRGASRPGSSGDRNGIGGDPRGYFIVEADRAACTIVASQYVDGLLVRRYTARRAEVLQRYIVRDMAVSDLSHALWLGQELARAEFALNCDERTGV